MKIDRIRRKENPLGCATPQQSTQGLKQPPLLPAGRTAVGSCLSSFRESLLTSIWSSLALDNRCATAVSGEIFFRLHDLTNQPLSFGYSPVKRATRSRSDTPALRLTSATSWAYCSMVWLSRRGTARSATLLTPPGRMCPAIAS
ncbi:hypothetical protein T03_11693 [Trichinella britovi]|uniref:Uncharacterized protein n=1 Tax=Trichinella britovi TaxID=45882 RepID=A0A0V1D5T5_TRIBR|nr:hypothetical protein T03_11693 [Trichinella britovi]